MTASSNSAFIPFSISTKFHSTFKSLIMMICTVAIHGKSKVKLSTKSICGDKHADWKSLRFFRSSLSSPTHSNKRLKMTFGIQADIAVHRLLILHASCPERCPIIYHSSIGEPQRSKYWRIRSQPESLRDVGRGGAFLKFLFSNFRV